VNNSVSIGARDIKPSPLDASCNDESNELRFIILCPIDGETPGHF